MNNNARQNAELNTLLNKCSHKILGIRSYSKTSSSNLKKLNWVSYYQMIMMGGVKLIHKVIVTHRPIALFQYMKQSMINTELDSRLVRHSYIKRQAKTNRTSNSFLYRVVKFYNTLPLTVKSWEPKVFNTNIKDIIRKGYSPDKVQ